jgi:hypothetical protein
MAASGHLSKLRVDVVAWQGFIPFSLMHTEELTRIREMVGDYCPNLTSVHLTFTTINGNRWYNDHIHPPEERCFFQTLLKFLHRLTKLQSLCLSLERLVERNGIVHAPLTCPIDIALERIWPDLRKLSLAYFELSSENLAKLVLSHAETLENLRLKNIRLL